MRRHPAPTPTAGDLRSQAEKRLQAKVPLDTGDLSGTDARTLVYELQVHQIGLEMHNDELQRTQAEAQEALQKYTELFAFAPVGYFLADRDGIIREANLAGAALAGRERRWVIKQPFARLVAPAFRPQFAALWNHLWATSTKQSCELALLNLGQDARPVVLEAAVLSDLPGGERRALLAVTDITTHKHAEEALRAAHHELERRVAERTAELQRTNIRLAQEIEVRKRMEEDIAKQLRFETLLADLSARFVNLPASEVDREIMEAERRICELLGLDLSALWQLSDDAPGFFMLTHFYSAQEGPLPPGRLNQDDYPWVKQQLQAGRTVVLSSLDDLPPEAARDRESARQIGIKSSLCLPLSVGGEPPIGVLCLNTTRVERDWPEALVKRLQLVAQIFANALARKRADQALRESEERMTLAAEAAQVGVWGWNIAGNHVWGSERWLRLFGFAAGEHISFEKIIQRIHPDDRETVAQEVRRALARGSDYTGEFRTVLPDGTQRWIASKGRMHADANGKPARMLGAAIDISERKQAEAEVLRQRAELAHMARVSTLGQLASALAHELNQPLGAILRNAEAAELFLQDPSPDLEEVRAILADIRKDDQRAGAVIERLRAMMKRHAVEHLPLDLHLLTGEVVTLVRPDAEMRRVQLAVETASVLPPVQGDRVQLQQVLLNLIINAMEAMNESPPEKRLVAVRARPAGAAIEVMVSDSGHGIAEDQLARIFEPFFTSKPNGLGMGLVISRNIIEAHGGRLWAENNPAGGATFHFTLPAVKGDNAP